MCLSLYENVHRWNPSTNICVVTMDENHMGADGVKCRLKQDIPSMFISNYFAVRQETSQWSMLVTMLISDDRFKTPQTSERSPRIIELSNSVTFMSLNKD